MIYTKKNNSFKIFIIIFWLITILTFLYLPNLKQFFLVDKTINILTWPDMINQELATEFQKKTGIKVNLNFYETHEELYSKLQISNGKGYDLVTVTDSGIKNLIEKKIFKKLNKKKLKFWQDLNPRFLNQYFDKNNNYSIPLNWDIFGLGIDKSYFLKRNFIKSWAMIFDKNLMPKKITMLEDPYDNILIAAQYLFGTTKNIDNNKFNLIKQLLIEQQPNVEAYGDLRADYFLKLKICPIVTSQSAYIYRTYKTNLEFGFVIPQEGGFKVIDSIAIISKSKKDDLIYEFLNFIFSKEVNEKIYYNFGYLPVLTPVLESLNLDYMEGKQYVLSDKIFNKLEYFKRTLDLDQVSDLWVDVKSN